VDHEVPQGGVAGGSGDEVRDLIRDICGQHEVSIMKGHVSKDHVHLLIIARSITF